MSVPLFRAGQGGGSEPGRTLITHCVLPTDHRNHILTTILVTIAFTVGITSLAAYLYNRQRKIQKYKLQKAQEAAAMKLNTPATPP